MPKMLERLIERWNSMGTPVEQRLCDALNTIGRMHDERLELQRRIHNQRRQCRETWEIVEQRRKWLGTAAARSRATFWRDQYRKLKAARVDGQQSR